MSAISQVNNFFSIKAWIPTKMNTVKAKGRKPVPVKWRFKSKEEADGLFRLNSRNVVNGYMKVQGFEFTDSLSPVVLETSTRILIVLTLYYEYYGWIVELCNVEAVFLHTNIEFEIYIEKPEGIADLGIITKAFVEEYCILLRK